MPRTSSAAVAAVPAALAVLVIGVAAPASAHVTLDASSTGAVGESAWTEVGEDDVARADLEMPAPVIVVTATDGSSADPAMSSGAMSHGAAGLLGLACLGSFALLLLRRRRA